MHLVVCLVQVRKRPQNAHCDPTVLFIFSCTLLLIGSFDWALLLLCGSLLSAQDNCSLQKTFDNVRQCMFGKINICKTCSVAMPVRNDILYLWMYSSRINIFFPSRCLYFRCSATERQHSTNAGACMWLLGFRWGESFHRLFLCSYCWYYPSSCQSRQMRESFKT